MHPDQKIGEVPLWQPHDFRLRAQAEGNPFFVEVSATFEHESGLNVGPVPGFYDGDDTWVVRFSPTLEGRWRGRTSSPVSGLNGIELGPLTAVPNDNPRVHGRVRIDPAEPRRFRFEDGTAYVPLGFEFDWLFAYHQAHPDGCREVLQTLVERGFNHIVTNVYAHTGFSPQGHPDVYGPPRLYVFGGTNDAPDHSRLNVEFFRDFDRVVALACELGIVLHLMLQVQNKHVRWPARRSPEDNLYWRYVVSRYQAFPNVVWDVGKESYYLLRETGSHDYTLSRIELMRAADAYGHLVTVHDSETGSACRLSEADRACDFVSDQIHLGETMLYWREAASRFRSFKKPYMNIEYGYEEGVDPIKTYRGGTTRPWQDIVLWTWAIYLGGGYPCYYYSNMAWDLVKPDPEPPGWSRLAAMKQFLDGLELNRMVPDRDYVNRGLCLAEHGKQYLIFLPEGGDVEVDLTAVQGPVRGTMLDAFTGERAQFTLSDRSFRARVENRLPIKDHPCAIALRAEEA